MSKAPGQYERTFPPKDKLFARAFFAQVQGRETGADIERFLDPRNAVSREILARANTSPATTTVTGWAAEIVRESFRPFLASLAPYSGAARLIELAVPGNLTAENTARYPFRNTAPATPPWVGENEPIPVTSGSLTSVTLGPPKKMGHILPWSRELSRRTDADAVFETMLREDIAAGLDNAFFATSGGSAAAHAGLLNGVTAITASGATGKLGMVEDLTALAAAASVGGSGKVTFIMAPERVAMARIIAPSLAANLDLVASAAIPTTRVICADGASLVVSVDPEPSIDISNHATLHMSDVPLEIVSDTGPTTADPVRSLWQTATTSARILYDLAFAKRRSTAVAYLDGAYWQ